MTSKLPEIEEIIKIPFHHVDFMGVVWHGRYLEYFEITRAKLLGKFNYSYMEMKESGFAWPVIDTRIRYIKPALLGQKIRVKASIAEYDLRLKIQFLITDFETNQRIAKGYTIQVAVDFETNKMHFGSPPILYKKLGVKP